MEILWNFQGDFWKNLQRITKTSNNFIEKLGRNPKEILEISGALSKIYLERFKALSGTENTSNIFQNNILLVSPLTTYSMKTMFASLLAILWSVYIKNTISINIDIKNFPYSHHYTNEACENEVNVWCRRVTEVSQTAFRCATNIRRIAEWYAISRLLVLQR